MYISKTEIHLFFHSIKPVFFLNKYNPHCLNIFIQKVVCINTFGNTLIIIDMKKYCVTFR